ncbi:MAG: hypothetical protein ACOY3F_02820 [Bacillota bacterium]
MTREVEIEVVRNPRAEAITLVVSTPDGAAVTVVRADTDLTIGDLKAEIIQRAGLSVPANHRAQLYLRVKMGPDEQLALLQDGQTLTQAGLKNGSHLALVWQAVMG